VVPALVTRPWTSELPPLWAFPPSGLWVTPAAFPQDAAFPHEAQEDSVAKDVKNTLDNTKEIEITVTGRRSGREISTPVWFVREGEKLYLVPVSGSDSDWFKNVRKTRRIRVAANGTAIESDAMPITDAGKVGDIVEKFRDKYGADQVQEYYPKRDVAVEVPLR
jgi:deazaflavin-dependent oxidoreductase (nitroreductase family)